MAPPRAAGQGTVWDGRFRLRWDDAPPDSARTGARIGALAADAPGLRARSDLPASVLVTLPAVRCRGKLVTAPHLGYDDVLTGLSVIFAPAVALAAAPFRP